MAKTIHIVVRDGFIEGAYADFPVDVIVYDLDCTDPDMKAEVELAISEVKQQCHEVEIY